MSVFYFIIQDPEFVWPISLVTTLHVWRDRTVSAAVAVAIR